MRSLPPLSRRASAPGRPSQRSAVDIVVIVATLIAGVVGVVMAEGDPPRRFSLEPGAAWLVSASVGMVTLVDGHSVEVAARVPVADPRSGLVAAQDGMVAVAADASDGDVLWVDPSSLVPDAPVRGRLHPRGGLALHVSGSRGYLLDMAAGDVFSVKSGLPGLTERLDLGEPIRSSALDASGRLWVLGAGSGTLEWVDDAGTGTVGHASAGAAHAEVRSTGGLAALVEPAARRVRAWGPSGAERSACLGVGAGDETVRSGGAEDDDVVYLASGRDGRLTWSDLGTGECGTGVDLPGAAGHLVGDPLPAGRLVFVPDETSGTVYVADPDAGRVLVTEALMPAGTAFELLEQDGIVFYNDPQSHRAGVVHPDGSFTAVDKFDPDDPSGVGAAAPGEDPPDESAPPTTVPPVPVVDFPDLPPPTESPDQASAGTPGDPEAPTTSVSSIPETEPTGLPPPDVESEPATGEAPALSDIRIDTEAYIVGDTVHLTADIDGPFTDCRWTIGDTTVTCAPSVSDGPATVSGSTVLTTPGQVAVTLTVTGPGGTSTRHGTVVVDPRGTTEASNLRVLTPQPEREDNTNPNGDYVIGQDIEVAGDVVGSFPECAWLVGDQTYECVRGETGPGPETVTGIIPLRTFGDVPIRLSTGEGRVTQPLIVYAHDATLPISQITDLTFVQTGPATTYIRFSVTMRDPESGLDVSGGGETYVDFNGYSWCSLSEQMNNGPTARPGDVDGVTWTPLADGFIATGEATLSCPRAAEGDVILEGTNYLLSETPATNNAGGLHQDSVVCGAMLSETDPTVEPSCDEIR
jgi:hypothetical protein